MNTPNPKPNTEGEKKRNRRVDSIESDQERMNPKIETLTLAWTKKGWRGRTPTRVLSPPSPLP
jgi:hypothetical protein